jgi:alpha-L-rhamnosidase
MKSRLLPLIFFLFLTVALEAQIHPTQLRCEDRPCPSVVDERQPRLSWIDSVPAAVRGEEQRAYQFVVASSREKLLRGEGDVWNSGKVKNAAHHLVCYAGGALQSGHDYWWRVRVWNRRGRASEWSEPARWGMGLLDKSDWQARWIVPTAPGEAAPLLVRQFALQGAIRQAKVFVCGLGYFELYVNGQRIGNDVLVPHFTNYMPRTDIDKRSIAIPNRFAQYRAQYLCYDVTTALREGRNAVGAILGNGFFNCHNAGTSAFGPCRLLLQMEITYADGHRQLVCTDGQWRSHPSVIVMNDIYNGETDDARQEVPHWAEPQNDLAGWASVTLVDMPETILSAQTAPADKVTEELRPLSLQRQADGTWLVDFGKEISGWLHFRHLSGAKGDTLRVKYVCESPEGQQQYIFSGSGDESYAPRFTWFVFSKAVISGIRQLDAGQLTAEAVNTDVPLTATFECSNPLFERINAIWQRSQMDNMHGGVASDCPHRERLPYTGDAQAACQTVMHNFDAAAFYRKWIRDMRDAQNPDDGYVPNAAPWQPRAGGGMPWGAAVDIIPWQYYLHYGDTLLLSRCLPAMRSYADYLQRWLTPDSTLSTRRCEVGQSQPAYWLNLGDWVPPYGMPAEGLVETYFLWLCEHDVAEAAQSLGRTAEAAHYRQRAEATWRAFHRVFYDAKAQTYGDFGGNVFALAMGVPADRQDEVVAALRHEVVDVHGGHLHTGIFGTQLLFETLARYGLNDVAYTAMNKTDFPSFGNWIRQGATTTWEQWDGGNSHNHPMFGGALTWFYRSLAGVNVDAAAPGYRHILIQPVLCDSVQRVKYAAMTAQGRVSSEVINRDGAVALNIEIPVGSTATVFLPFATGEAMESGLPLRRSQGVSVREVSKNGVTVEVGQGEYRFKWKPLSIPSQKERGR